MNRRLNHGWIAEALEPSLLPGTKVLKRDGSHLLDQHPSIPWEADHVTIEGDAYRVIPNPCSLKERAR